MKQKYNPIVLRNTTPNQVFLEISHCICDRQLDTALDILEHLGITGDTALFVVGNIQKLGGAG